MADTEQQVVFLNILICSALIGIATGSFFQCMISIATGEVITSAITGGIAAFTFWYVCHWRGFRVDKRFTAKTFINYSIIGAIVGFAFGESVQMQNQSSVNNW